MLLAHGLDLTAGTEVEVDDSLYATQPLAGNRKERPKKIIVDWSGNEMSGPEYARFLAKGKTSAHLYIDHEGTIWQFVDLAAEYVNRSMTVDKESIWIVLQNKGMPPADSRVKRGVWNYAFGKHQLPALGATADQLDALEEILLLLCESFRLEPTLPRRNGEVVMQPLLRKKTLERWTGILLASHLSSDTVSPGPGVIELLDELEEGWFAEDEIDEDEEDTDLDGEEQEIDEEAFEADFPDPS